MLYIIIYNNIIYTIYDTICYDVHFVYNAIGAS